MSIEITKENFEAEVLHSEIPVLVDFWSNTCMPCKMLAPVVQALAESAHGYKVVKVCIDDAPELAQTYAIMVVPTLIAFKNGEIAGQLTGVQPQEVMEDLMKGIM